MEKQDNVNLSGPETVSRIRVSMSASVGEWASECEFVCVRWDLGQKCVRVRCR